jgi:hypothetical protein
MTLTELKALVSYWVDDLEFGYFTETQLTAFLNNAQKEVQKMLLRAGENFYTKMVQTSTVTNQTDYVLPSDFLKVQRVELILAGSVPNEQIQSLDMITMNQKDLIMEQTSSVPRAFYLHRDRIVLCPIPDKVYTLRITYSYLVSDMTTGSSVPDVPTQYHEYIAVVAALDCFLKDDRVPNTLLEKKAFYENMMKRDQEDRVESKTRMVVVTEESCFEVY